jgi:hypothetical protein
MHADCGIDLTHRTKSWRSISAAPAFIFTKSKSHTKKIMFNIANKISSFGGTTAHELEGIMRGNIEVFTGWRIRNNEGKGATQMTETIKITAEQNRTERIQNSGHQQQTMRIQEIAPALLFSAITNYILLEGAKQ